MSKLSNVSNTIIPLGISATFTGPWIPVELFEKLCAGAFANQTGTLYIDQSQDGTNQDISSSIAIPASGNGASLVVDTVLLYARIRIVNGASAQATLRAALNGKRV